MKLVNFGAHNSKHQMSVGLNTAARTNDVDKLKLLLSKNSNPNCVDSRGWTAVHEAAASNSIDCLRILLEHNEFRITETYEGHTALYLACSHNCSLEVINLILERVPEIVGLSSNEKVSPLHVACHHGREDIVDALLAAGADIDAIDFDEDTPLHDAVLKNHHNVVSLLLHAGANLELRNFYGLTPLHMACFDGTYECFQAIVPFVTDINIQSANGSTPLMYAAEKENIDIVESLLKNGADPDIENAEENIPVFKALTHGSPEVFKCLLKVTDLECIPRHIIKQACKPHYFSMIKITALLESELTSYHFNYCERFFVQLESIASICPDYSHNSPLGSFLHIAEYIYNVSENHFEQMLYLFLMRGVAVNALYKYEVPPLLYIHYCEHTKCFLPLMHILIEHGCDVDYCSFTDFPDIILTSVMTGADTMPHLLQYSLYNEPDEILMIIMSHKLEHRTSKSAIDALKVMCENSYHTKSTLVGENALKHLQPQTASLKHICRLQLRKALRNAGIKSTQGFLRALDQLPLPKVLKMYLRYS